jgi:alpha-glucosidase (family GH31 glycosyl hydrolase)
VSRRTTVATLALSLIFGSMAAVSITPTPAQADTITIGDVRVQTLSSTLARVELKGPNGFEDRATYHVVGRDAFTGEAATTSVDGAMTKVVTADYTVFVPTGATSLANVRIEDSAGHILWSYNGLPASKQYLPSPAATPKAWAVSDSPRVVPASWGYDPMPATNTDFTDYNGWDSTNDAPDVYVFLPAGSATQLRADFNGLFGQSELIPLKSLGLWHSRYWAYSEQEIYDTIDDYRAKGFPLDTFVVDTDWRAGGQGFDGSGYYVNTTLFPNMAQFLTNLHTTYHVNTAFNDHPEPVNGNHALTQDDLQFRNTNLKSFLNMGMDAWWYDRNWGTTIVTPFSGIPKESFGMYLYQAITKSARPNQRPMIIGNVDGIDNGAWNRAPDLSSHRYTYSWTGDIGVSDSSLKQEIQNDVRSGALTATPYVSADIGGHTSQPSVNQFIRWSQFGALAPIFRYHVTKGQNLFREPWKFGTQAEGIALDYIEMRYRLLPLFYSLAHQNYETGLPINKRLDFNYPQYSAASSDTQYLLGDNILVAPIWETKDATTAVPAAWLGAGVSADYYNNTDLTGSPVYSTTEANVDHNWGSSGPGNGVDTNNFSARYTGTITIGSDDVKLGIVIDDGGKLYVDGQLKVDSWGPNDSVTYLSPDTYLAGSTHTITFEYYEGTGNARAQLVYQPTSVADVSRDVFIPDGRWIDVFSGQTYDGPATVSVTHPLETSPIFVRQGSIIPLAQNVDYIGQSDWSTIGLDVYPSTQYSGASEVYEDDGLSEDYKSGVGRTTALSTSYDSVAGEAVINVAAATGSYAADGITNRTWKARVHVPSGWGAVQSATLNGSSITGTLIPAATSGDPFAITGASNDTDVYEITWTAPLSQASEVRVKFATPQDEPTVTYTNTAIQHSAWNVELTGNTGATSVNLSAADDWIKYARAGNSTNVDRKNIATPIISTATYSRAPTAPAAAYDYKAAFSWNDGTPTSSASSDVNMMHTQNNGATSTFNFTAEAATNWRQLDIYFGCWQATCTVDITDPEGTLTRRKVTAGSSSTNQQMTVVYRGEPGTHLDIELAAGYLTNSNGNVSFSAVSVKELPDATVEPELSLEVVPATLNLTEAGTTDWAHFGYQGAAAFDHKANPDEHIIGNLTQVTYVNDAFSPANDYTMESSWTDGNPTVSASGRRDFAYTWSGVKLPLTFPVGHWVLDAYTSAWGADASYTLVADDGSILAQTTSPSVGETTNVYSDMRLDIVVTSPLNATLYFIPSYGMNDHRGNGSMPVVTVKQIKVDTTALEAALAAAAALVSTDYTPNSWADYIASAAVSNGELVLANPLSTEAEVSSATSNIVAAIAALVERADFTDLAALVADALLLNPAAYDIIAWAEVAVVLPAAQAVLADMNSTQAQVDAALQALEDAIAGLKPRLDPVIDPALSTLTPVVGSPLEVVDGYFTTPGVTVTYSWDGAGSPTNTAVYTPVAADVGNRLHVTVTVTEPGHLPWTGVLTTTPVAAAPVAPTPAVAAKIAPQLSTVNPVAGTIIQVLPGDYDPAATESYAWTIDGMAAGSNSSYAIPSSAAGKTIKVTVTAAAPGATPWTATLTTAPVTAAPVTPTPAVTPSIVPQLNTVNPMAGGVIELLPGNYSPAATETYAWTIDGVAAGTSRSLVIPADAVGKTIKVTVTAAAPGATPWSATLTTALVTAAPVDPGVDTYGLSNLVASVSTLDSSAYTAGTWNSLNNAKNAALEVLGNASSTQSQVDAAIATLQHALVSLVPVSDTATSTARLATLLSEQITAANALNVDDYTPASWAPVAAALAAANTVKADANATADQLQTAMSNLAKAVTALKPVEVIKEGATKVVEVEKPTPTGTTQSVTVSGAKFKKNTKPKVTVTIKVTTGNVKGRVALFVGGKKVKTFNAIRAKSTVTIPKKYSKAIKVRAKYAPKNNKYGTTKYSKTKTIKVK